MCTLITSAEDGDDLPIGFDRSRDTRKQKLTNNKYIKRKYPLRIIPKYVFGLTEHQEHDTNAPGYKLAFTRKKDEAVIDEAVDITDARIKIDHFHCYIPHYTPCIDQQGKLSKQSLSKTPTDLRYFERCVL